MMRSPWERGVRVRGDRRASRRPRGCELRRHLAIGAALCRGQRDRAALAGMIELDGDLGVVEVAERRPALAVLAGREDRAGRPLAVPGVVGGRVATVPHEVAAVRELPGLELPASAEVDPSGRCRTSAIVAGGARARHAALLASWALSQRSRSPTGRRSSGSTIRARHASPGHQRAISWISGAVYSRPARNSSWTSRPWSVSIALATTAAH